MIDVVGASATSIGRVRRINEDAVLVRFPIFLVADGMGGHAAGDVASSIVVEEFATADETPSITSEEILGMLRRSDDRIRAAGGGGTTVAGVATVEQSGAAYWLVFNLGDSRVYLRDAGKFAQISVDHSLVQEMVDAGELSVAAARRHPQRHIITRAVGAPELPNPDFWLIPARSGDRAVMCSDGLTTELTEAEIERLVMDVVDPQALADLLVAGAVESGGRDNVSVVVVDITTAGTVDRSLAGIVAEDDLDAERTIPRASVPVEKVE